jgi:hypothetical protein
VIIDVINNEIQLLSEKGLNILDSVEKMNQFFLNNNSVNYDCILEASKIFYEIDTVKNREDALNMIFDFEKLKITFSVNINY